jgi:branched-chain amino acid transport system permease protein
MAIFIQYTVNGLTAGAFYALVALGYTIIYGIIRLINFAHGDLTMVGAFIGWTALVSLGLQRLPVILAIALAALVSMAVTSVINVGILRFAYKPLLNRSLLAILITALGMSIFLQNAALLVFGAGVQAYPHLVTSSGVFIGGVRISFAQTIFFTISLLLMAGLYAFARFTTLGTAMRALAVDHDAARLMGINVDRVIAIAFILAAILAAAAGVMIGLYYTQINFFLGFLLGLRAFTSAVLGGIGNIPGAMAGGLLIGLLESYCAGYLSGRWQDVFVFGVLIAVLIIKPTGLFGERVAERM